MTLDDAVPSKGQYVNVSIYPLGRDFLMVQHYPLFEQLCLVGYGAY